MRERLGFYIRHSLNDLRVNGRRTLFALLCIAVGVAAIVSLQTLGLMIKDTLTTSLQESNGGDLQINAKAERDTPAEIVQLGKEQGIIESNGGSGIGPNESNPDYFSPLGLEQIQNWFETNYPGATLTHRQIYAGGNHGPTSVASISNPRTGDEQAFIAPYVVDAQVYPLYGEKTSEDDQTLHELLREPTDIVISRNLADTLDAQVGDTLRLSNVEQGFTLRGIVPTDAESGLENLSGSLFGYYYVDLGALDLFVGAQPGADRIFVRLPEPAQVEEINIALREQFPYLNTTTTGDLNAQNSELADILGELVSVMGLVSLLIGGIGIVNTMRVIVGRRTTEVAVLKTVGLEGEQVTALFMVEAALMGLFGGLAGIVLGWLAAFALKGMAGAFLAQTLTFRITLAPALTGLVVGVLVTTVFGFLPTLAAGQVRPNLVLRPNDAVAPQAGRSRSLVALLVVLLALSAVAQSLIGDLLDADMLRLLGRGVGAFVGALLGLAMASGDLLAERTRGNVPLRLLRWASLLVGLPVLGLLFGGAVPAILILFGVFIVVGLLYLLLWALIWLVGRFFPTWRLVDLKIALRSMLAARGRGAATLLALVIGVFALSLLTMLTSALTARFEKILVDEVGGNVIVFASGQAGTLERVQAQLVETEGVKSSTVTGAYSVELVSLRDASTGEVVPYAELKTRASVTRDGPMPMHANRDRFREVTSSIDARGVDSNLPDLDFYAGRQLTPQDAGKPYIVVSANEETLAAGFDVGDELTFRLGGNGDSQEITFEIVGMVDRIGSRMSMDVTAPNYAPLDAFPEEFAPDNVNAIVDVEKDQIGALRRTMNEIPGVFVLETRLLNDLVNRFIAQFSSFPILVAALALFTGGVVIANSVALSTLERRREIGIMKAVGLQRERVLGTLLLEYGIMGLIGGLIGVGIGGVTLLLLLTVLFGGSLSGTFPYLTALGLAGLCIAITLLAASLTAWGASGEKPLNVLRYE
jgi:predicted lysophospholipase L1 biosynthesis ABC-type transport system permease subunit